VTTARKSMSRQIALSREIAKTDFTGASCASLENRSIRDYWTADYNEYDPSTARRMKETAYTICTTECPVLVQCAKYALKNPEEIGIWGGMDEDARRGIRQRFTL
jgi:hypothetical protein